MEIYYNGGWGTVCNNSWDIRDTRVACRQLGFQDSEFTYPPGTFGEGTGPILMDEVHCTGSESSLWSCIRNEVGNHDCSHSQDVAIRCSDTGGENYENV